MAAKWQQWMPLNINKIRGSMFFMSLPDSAKVGYLFLLMAQWETEDGAISADPIDLAVLSGLGDRWEEFGPRILRKFEPIEGGKLRNGVLHREWLEAKRVYEARRTSAKHTNERKPEQSDAVTATVTDAVTVPVTATVTGTHKHKQEQEHKQKDIKTFSRSVPPEQLAGTLPLVDGSDFPISKEQLNQWAEAFPGVDVRGQLKQAKAWLEANPTRRKTQKGIMRFAVNWLDRAQNRGGANGERGKDQAGSQDYLSIAGSQTGHAYFDGLLKPIGGV